MKIFLTDSVLRVENGQCLNISRQWLVNVFYTLFGCHPNVKPTLSDKEQQQFASVVRESVEDILTTLQPCTQPLTWYNPFAAIWGGKVEYKTITGGLQWELIPISFGHGFSSQETKIVWKTTTRIETKKETETKVRVKKEQPKVPFFTHRFDQEQQFAVVPWQIKNRETGEMIDVILPIHGQIKL